MFWSFVYTKAWVKLVVVIDMPHIQHTIIRLKNNVPFKFYFTISYIVISDINLVNMKWHLQPILLM